MVPIGEQHFRRAMAEYVAHDDAERLHQGCGNMLLRPASPSQPAFMIAAKTSGSVTPSDPISKTRAFASSPRVRRMSWQSAAAISAASPATALSPASIFGSSPAGQASMRTALLMNEYPVGVGSRVVGRLWPDVRRGGQTLIMGYSADKSPLIGHLAGSYRRLEPLGAQRQEKCMGTNRSPTPHRVFMQQRPVRARQWRAISSCTERLKACHERSIAEAQFFDSVDPITIRGVVA